MLKADGLDDALIGVGRRCGEDEILVYSVRKCLEILMRHGATYEEALEHFEFNISGAWVGPETPMWVYEDALEEVLCGEPNESGSLTEEARSPIGT